MHPFGRPLPTISLAVVGAEYPNRDGSSRRAEIDLHRPSMPVMLRPEPDNRRDPRAVAVYSARGVQLGYLTAERCGRIGAIIRSGREVRAAFQASAPFGAWIRVAFDGQKPIIPLEERVPRAEAELDFHPDEIWPDD